MNTLPYNYSNPYFNASPYYRANPYYYNYNSLDRRNYYNHFHNPYYNPYSPSPLREALPEREEIRKDVH
jgi:hypothetical protein